MGYISKFLKPFAATALSLVLAGSSLAGKQHEDNVKEYAGSFDDKTVVVQTINAGQPDEYLRVRIGENGENGYVLAEDSTPKTLDFTSISYCDGQDGCSGKTICNTVKDPTKPDDYGKNMQWYTTEAMRAVMPKDYFTVHFTTKTDNGEPVEVFLKGERFGGRDQINDYAVKMGRPAKLFMANFGEEPVPEIQNMTAAVKRSKGLTKFFKYPGFQASSPCGVFNNFNSWQINESSYAGSNNGLDYAIKLRPSERQKLKRWNSDKAVREWWDMKKAGIESTAMEYVSMAQSSGKKKILRSTPRNIDY